MNDRDNNNEIGIDLNALTESQRSQLQRIAALTGESLQEVAQRSVREQVIQKAHIPALKRTPRIGRTSQK